MPEATPTTSTTPTTDEDQDPHLADVPTQYDEGTFVLVGCGAAKRDPDDPVDLHEAAVAPGEDIGNGVRGTGPAWEARDLYTSSYFAAKREYAELATQWARDRDGWAWSILSAEHSVLAPWELVKPYDTTIDDLGDDYMNDDHLSDFAWKYRPDGKPLITELDAWVTRVAVGLQRWLQLFDDPGYHDPTTGVARNLIVIAGRDYVDPLRERGAFNGLGEMRDGHPGIEVEPTFLFEEIDADGIGEQLAWLSDAVSRVEERRASGEQSVLGGYTDA